MLEAITSLLAGLLIQPLAVIHLFAGPFVTLGENRVEIPQGSKRLLVFVAMHGAPVDRRHAAGVLWPVGNDVRAAGNLRSALWRLNRAGLPLLNVDNLGLALRAGVVVDLTLISEWAARLISGSPSNADLGILPSGVGALELLPGWYEDWVLLERERVRQRVLHAIDVQSRTLTQMGRYAEAVDAAMIAVASDPLRESAQFALIEAHLAEGNWTEGRRRFEAYQDLVRHELGSEPSAHLTALFNTVKKQSLGRVERLSALQYR